MSFSPLVLEAGRADRHYFADLWQYRELLFFLAWRDVAVHYKQTLVGVAWAVVRPLATVIVFVLVFNKLARLPADEIPYPVLVLGGMLPWQLVSGGLGSASSSLIGNSNLISKVYFPRLIVPLASVAVGVVDFLVMCPFLLIALPFYGVPWTWRLLALPALIVLALLAALGPGLWLCALNVRFRDVQYVVPFMIQFGLYISPVGYSSSLVPEEFQWLYAVNPMVGIIEGFRWSIGAGRVAFPLPALALSLFVSSLFLAGGLWYFRRTERTFADLI